MPTIRTLTFEEQSLIASARSFVEQQMKDDHSGHDHHHVFRVYHMAMHLSKHTHANPLVVALAALLHDIDDPKRLAPGDPADGVARYLSMQNLTMDILTSIHDIIDNMSFSSQQLGKQVTTLEGKIVQDADRLDAIGAIGIGRAFAYGGHKGRSMFQGQMDDDSTIAHFYQKLLQLEERMNTPMAKRLAKRRSRFLRRFLNEFEHEWHSQT